MRYGIQFVRALAFLGFVASFAVSQVNAAEVAGVKLEDTVKVGGQELKLNGAGIRHKVIFKVYVAGLYLSEKKSTVQDVLAATGPRRVKIVTLRDIGSEEFGRGLMSGIQLNLDRTEKAKLTNQLLKLGEVFAQIPELKKGDVVLVDWIPNTGTVMYVDGKQIVEPLPDIAFYNALLKMWLGEKPLDVKLKPLLLGQKPDEAL
ncbi:chalcone isomerase family protein [Noviherbaspirillum massiliense]|uniref:chalcone isomerase family protein n=1 Tax=Noviherbaspirillum massiliense TaxID=1465823 RepID=UPI0002DFA022|nr:chalcone isomerase family protein [Noviherbaspirillum massiliense]